MFGLVTGLGVGAGIFYYRSLVNAHLGRGLSPRILMVHADVRRVMAHAAAHERQLLATYLTGSLGQLADHLSTPAGQPMKGISGRLANIGFRDDHKTFITRMGLWLGDRLGL